MNRKNIITLASLLLTLALVFIFIDPLWSSAKILRSEIARQQADLNKINELLEKTQKLDQELASLEEESQRIFLALPEEKDVPNLLIQFEALALNNGLLLESINFGDFESTQESSKVKAKEIEEEDSVSSVRSSTKKKIALRKIPVEISINGSYSAFKKYLVDLEKSVRSMNVNSIKLLTGAEGEEASILTSAIGIFEFNLGLEVYYQ